MVWGNCYLWILEDTCEAASLQIRFGYMMHCGNQGSPMRKQFEQLKHRFFRHRTSRRRRCSMWRTCCLRLNKLITNWEILPCNCPGTLGIGKRKHPGRHGSFAPQVKWHAFAPKAGVTTYLERLRKETCLLMCYIGTHCSSAVTSLYHWQWNAYQEMPSALSSDWASSLSPATVAVETRLINGSRSWGCPSCGCRRQLSKKWMPASEEKKFLLLLRLWTGSTPDSAETNSHKGQRKPSAAYPYTNSWLSTLDWNMADGRWLRCQAVLTSTQTLSFSTLTTTRWHQMYFCSGSIRQHGNSQGWSVLGQERIVKTPFEHSWIILQNDRDNSAVFDCGE